MRFGLREEDITYMIEAFEKFPEIEKAAIFGSRAKGNYKRGSDVDIAIFGEQVTFDTVSELHTNLEDESPMPYFFDILDYTHTNDESILAHIDRRSVTIYKKSGD